MHDDVEMPMGVKYSITHHKRGFGLNSGLWPKLAELDGQSPPFLSHRIVL
jgi:hypothetical protein